MKESKEVLIVDGWMSDEELEDLAARTGKIVVSEMKDDDD